MRLIAGLEIGVAMLVAATVGAVHFDEYGGVVPTDKKAAKCELKAAVQVAKAVKKLTACHMKRALGKGDEAAEEACEKSAADAFDSKVHGCPAAPCLDNLTGAGLTFVVDGQSGTVYCAGKTPFGDDNSTVGGFSAKVPDDKATAKCENKVAVKTAKLTAAVIGCHVQAAKAAIKAVKANGTVDPDGDKSCEDAARSAFKSGTSTTGCDCINLDGIATAVVNLNDLAIQRIACASPSGAFVDGTLD